MTKKQKAESAELFDEHLETTDPEYKRQFDEATKIIEQGVERFGTIMHDAMLRHTIRFELEAKLFADEPEDSIDMPYTIVDYRGGNA
jgi:hypothetical protein